MPGEAPLLQALALALAMAGAAAGGHGGPEGTEGGAGRRASLFAGMSNMELLFWCLVMASHVAYGIYSAWKLLTKPADPSASEIPVPIMDRVNGSSSTSAKVRRKKANKK